MLRIPFISIAILNALTVSICYAQELGVRTTPEPLGSGTGVYQPYDFVQKIQLNLSHVLNPAAAETAEVAYSYPFDVLGRHTSITASELTEFDRSTYSNSGAKDLIDFWTNVRPNYQFDSYEKLKVFDDLKYAHVDNPMLSRFWADNIATLDRLSDAPSPDAITSLIAFNRMVYENTSESDLRRLMYSSVQPSATSSVSDLLDLSRKTYGILQDGEIDAFLNYHGAVVDTEGQGSVEKIVGFQRDLYDSLENDLLQSYWEGSFGVGSQTKDYLVDRLSAFDRKIYENLDPEAFVELWNVNILKQDSAMRLKDFNRAAYSKLGEDTIRAVWDELYDQPPDDIVDRIVRFNRATYESLDGRALGLWFMSDPDSKWSTWFVVPHTGEEVLVGVDVLDVGDVEPDNLLFLTETALKVECGGVSDCGRRFISWYPDASINIFQAMAAE